MNLDPATDADFEFLERTLGRPMRGVVGVAWRNPQGEPGVVATSPRLPDGTPFPTTFYLTCPHVTKAMSRLEADGVMVHMNDDLAADAELRAAYEAAHEAYLEARETVRRLAQVDEVPEVDDVSAGGMPHRVKCLHALAGHALAAGSGVNPFGDRALALAGLTDEKDA